MIAPARKQAWLLLQRGFNIMARADANKPAGPSRRQLLRILGGLGIGSAVFQRALVAQAQPGASVTQDMVKQAEWIAGLTLSEEDRKSTAQALQQIGRAHV